MAWMDCCGIFNPRKKTNEEHRGVNNLPCLFSWILAVFIALITVTAVGYYMLNNQTCCLGTGKCYPYTDYGIGACANDCIAAGELTTGEFCYLPESWYISAILANVIVDAVGIFWFLFMLFWIARQDVDYKMPFWFSFTGFVMISLVGAAVLVISSLTLNLWNTTSDSNLKIITGAIGWTGVVVVVVLLFWPWMRLMYSSLSHTGWKCCKCIKCCRSSDHVGAKPAKKSSWWWCCCCKSKDTNDSSGDYYGVAMDETTPSTACKHDKDKEKTKQRFSAMSGEDN